MALGNYTGGDTVWLYVMLWVVPAKFLPKQERPRTACLVINYAVAITRMNKLLSKALEFLLEKRNWCLIYWAWVWWSAFAETLFWRASFGRPHQITREIESQFFSPEPSLIITTSTRRRILLLCDQFRYNGTTESTYMTLLCCWPASLRLRRETVG